MQTLLDHISTSHRKQLALISVAALIITSLFYGRILLNPGAFMFNEGNDAAKNYFALAWYVDNEEGLSFDGMKYPHEGFYLQTDGHPPIGVLLNILGANGSQAIALINWLMIMSITLSIVLFYIVFKRLKIPGIWAFIASVAIISLSPQLDRLQGHFALSYMFFFPLTFLQLLKLSDRSAWKSALFITFNLTFAYFLHPYLGVMLSFIVLGYIPYFVFRIRTRSLRFASIALFVSGIVPLVIWKLTVDLTDPVLNRTDDPWGFYEFTTRWDSMLLPRFDWPGLLPHTSLPPEYWEGLCYTGIGGYILAVGLLLLVSRIEFKWRNLVRNILLIIPCLIALSLAFGYPFIEYPELLEKAPFLEQFRALGRLSWIFYYIAIGGMFYALLKANGKRSYIFKGIAALAAFFFMLEGSFIHNRMANLITAQDNIFSTKNKNAFLADHDLSKFSEIDAIVPAPMYFIGSDTYGTETPPALLRECLKLSFYTGIPTTANSTSREPVIPSIQSIHLTAPDFYSKELIDHMDPRKSNLGVVTNDPMYEAMGYTCCGELKTPVLNTGEWQLYEQSKSTFQNKAIHLDSTLSAALHMASDTVLKTTNLPIHHVEFESPELVNKAVYNQLAAIHDTTLCGKTLNFSCWIFNPELKSHPGSIVVEKVREGSSPDWILQRTLTSSNILSGDSTRIDIDFKYPESNERVQFIFIPFPRHPHSISVNHVQIREKNTDVYQKRAKGVSMNNHLYMKHIGDALHSQ